MKIGVLFRLESDVANEMKKIGTWVCIAVR